jgi:shikimate dehydrogenase
MLHETLGSLVGLNVSYPSHDRNGTFAHDVPAFIAELAKDGVRGINVTHPFKGLVTSLATQVDPEVAAIGALNTLCFTDGALIGHNTDWSGFQEAFRRRFPGRVPKQVAMLGAGGFGKAAAFALAAMGAQEIRLFDPAQDRSEALAFAVRTSTRSAVTVCASGADAAVGSEGVLNCSPIGMHTHPGCPLDVRRCRGVEWVFDAVYSPLRTEFLRHAEEAGVATMSGVDLFFWQGIHAFQHFNALVLDDATIASARAVVQVEVDRRSAADA